MVERLRKIGFAKLTSVEDALDLLFLNTKTVSTEEIDTPISLNRIIAKDIESRIDVPGFDKSAMDGYALIAEDTFEASPNSPKYVKKAGKIEIGEASDLSINRGEAIRISTGAVIPEGADAVVKIEDTEMEGNNMIKIYNPVAPGKNVAKQGEDIHKGEIILKKGTELKAEHIALLSSQGIQKIQVFIRPKVSVFATGDELVEIGEPLGKSQIYNSNTPMIANLVRTYGGEVISAATLKDNKSLITKNLLQAIQSSDMVLFTGGTSVGTQDYLPEVVNENAKVLTHGVAMRPGEPILIAHKNDTLIFCLPGTPVAAYVGFLKFAGPAIRKMMSAKKTDPRKEIIAEIDRDIPVSRMGYLHYLRVYLETKEDKIIARSVRLKGSGIITSLTNSDGIVEISKDQEGLKAGEKILVKLLPI
ncbi:MAG: gephyrin-like molybdotransferase Glp [Promethearchaeati archaeon]